MKKHIKLLTIGTLLLGGLTGCNDRQGTTG